MVKREDILKKIAQRRLEKEQEAKLLESKRVKKPVFSTEQPQPRQVVRETLRRQPQDGPKTISEDIKLRTAGMNKAQTHMYKTLAENMVQAVKTLQEATQAGSGVYDVVNQGAGVGLMKTYFDIFFGYFPNLIVPEIASTQPIKTERAMIFYYNTVAGSTKGNVTKGDALITPFAVNTDVNYTSEYVNLPAIGDATFTFDTDHNTYASGTLAIWGPFIARSLEVENAELTWSSDTAFTGTWTNPSTGAEVSITNGTVIASASEITVSMVFASTADGWDPGIVIKYAYDNKYAPTTVPELNADIDARDIVAKARTVKTNYSFQSGYGFEAQFGYSLEEKLAESAMFELKRETDLDFVFEIMRSAPVQVVWNKGGGLANGLYEMHKLSFRDAVINASNYIYKVSKRVRGNVLIVGVNAQSIVETLPEFKSSEKGSQIGGPAVIGNLKEIKVIAVPSLGQDDWAVIYKNEKDNLDAGIVFAPYIPVVATTPVTLDDLVIRRAYTMSYGKLVVNANYFVKGTIVNNPIAMPMYIIGKDGSTYGTIGTDAVIPVSPDLPA